MEFVNNVIEATKYLTFAKVGQSERKRLLRYLSWISEENIYEKIRTDVKYAPSSIWRDWVEETFVGFSADKIVLKSGHYFGVSFESQLTGYPDGKNTVPGIFRQTSSFFLSHLRKRSPYTREELFRAFCKFYPGARFCQKHDVLMKMHPHAYLRAMEARMLQDVPPPDFLLEIGAGAAVNIALYHALFEGVCSVVIDLPETICAGYMLLSAFDPSLKICLPNDIDDEWDAKNYDVSFLLPYQSNRIPRAMFDLAINSSSFQEMSIDVVNNYISLIKETLRAGGHFISINHQVSRHIRGNTLAAYNLDGFTVLKNQQAIYSDWAHRPIKGVTHTFIQARKN